MKKNLSRVSHNVWYVNNSTVHSGYHVSVKKYDEIGSKFFYIDKSLLSDRFDRPRVRVIRDLGCGVCTIFEGEAISLIVNGLFRSVLFEDDRGFRFISRGFTKLYRLSEV